MDISPMAPMVAKAFAQSCTIEPWVPMAGPYGNGYDVNGQPIYGTPRTAQCRIAAVHERTDVYHKPPTKAKYLEDPLKEDLPEYPRVIVEITEKILRQEGEAARGA